DGRPIYGGTYFPPSKWVEILKQLHQAYTSNKNEVLNYAAKLTQGVQAYDLITVKQENRQFSPNRLDEMMLNWSRNFDNYNGGPNRAPKFPLPNNYEFLMQYAYLNKDTATMAHVDLTLRKMAFG